jgi:hypothetical protein
MMKNDYQERKAVSNERKGDGGSSRHSRTITQNKRRAQQSVKEKRLSTEESKG